MYNAFGAGSTTLTSGITTLERKIVSTYNPFRYRGYYYDTETSLYYLQSRYYDSNLGRFINPDSIDVITATPDQLTDKNLFAYCDNNPIMRTDEDGEFWNYVIGGAVGAVIGGVTAAISSYKDTGEVDWISVGINAAVGAVSGVVAASGLGIVAQAGISAVVSGVGNLADQAQAKGIDNINYNDVISSAALGGMTSAIGSGAGKIIGGKWLNQAKSLTGLGQSKLLTGMVRSNVGQSHSSLMRQGYKYIAQAAKPTNIYRGISSVGGSIISGGFGIGYNFLKSNALGW